MTEQVVGNYLRAHRRRCGLSQRDLGKLVGYAHEWQVSRHERSQTVPPLLIALAYEVVFQIPVAKLFAGFHSVVSGVVARNLEDLKAKLENRTGGPAKATLQKLQWLTERSR